MHILTSCGPFQILWKQGETSAASIGTQEKGKTQDCKMNLINIDPVSYFHYQTFLSKQLLPILSWKGLHLL